jgi:hypothetical protein
MTNSWTARASTSPWCLPTRRERRPRPAGRRPFGIPVTVQGHWPQAHLLFSRGAPAFHTASTAPPLPGRTSTPATDHYTYTPPANHVSGPPFPQGRRDQLHARAAVGSWPAGVQNQIRRHHGRRACVPARAALHGPVCCQVGRAWDVGLFIPPAAPLFHAPLPFLLLGVLRLGERRSSICPRRRLPAPSRACVDKSCSNVTIGRNETQWKAFPWNAQPGVTVGERAGSRGRAAPLHAIEWARSSCGRAAGAARRRFRRHEPICYFLFCRPKLTLPLCASGLPNHHPPSRS